MGTGPAIMPAVQLIRLDPAIEHAFASDPEFMDALVHDRWPEVAELVHRAIGRTLVPAPVSVNELRWGGYFVIDEATREVVGSCAFKLAAAVCRPTLPLLGRLH